MKTNYDLYITYPEKLIKADPKVESLVDTTIDNIRIALSRILQRDISIVAKGNDFHDADHNKFLQQASCAIMIISPDIENEPAYLSELQNICETFNISNIDLADGYNRVFKICLGPQKKELNPPCLNDLVSYNFYEKNIYNRKVRSLEFNESDKSATLYGRLLDLAYDISFSLKRGSKEESSYEKEKHCIYLGLTTFDQLQSRDDLRRELLHYGYKVLPQVSMPEQGEEFEKRLVSCLQQADTVIELMGSHYGDILKGTKYSMIDYQNRIIREFQEKEQGTKLRRFVWIPQNNRISDQRQALYLKRLRRDDASENTEIIESPLETFKTILVSKLLNSNHTKKEQFENISKIYLLTEEDQTKEVEEIYSTLLISGLKVTMLDYTEQVGIYARHLQALRDSDAVVIYQNSSNLGWLSSKMRDIIKAPGLGRPLPFKKVVIATKLPPDKHLVRLIKSRVEILDTSQSSGETILNKLISE